MREKAINFQFELHINRVLFLSCNAFLITLNFNYFLKLFICMSIYNSITKQNKISLYAKFCFYLCENVLSAVKKIQLTVRWIWNL